MIKLIYGKYQNLRNAAWRCLCEYKIKSLPVDVLHIARSAGIKVIKNRDVNELLPSESGVAIYDGEHWYIIYDEENPIDRCRFTVAHELGHIFLGHHIRKGYCARSKVFCTKPEIEQEADMFAARLLCPSCVLWGLNLHTADEIARTCRVSHSAAQNRAERMAILYKRNKFLSNPLEKEVYRNFQEYIKNTRG